MSRQGLVTLPPTRLDLAISERCVRAATPARERSLQVMTWLADEKIVLGAVGLFWLHANLRLRADEVRHEANRMLLSAVVAGLLPHRTLVHGPRHGIPHSGEAWDSFPSGHALHLGAIWGPVARLAPTYLRPFVWAGLLGLASTRIMLLAHYASDVVSGLAIGAALGKTVRKLTE